MVSSAIIPDKAAHDILNYPALGQERYEKFIDDRLLLYSLMSIWDPIPLLKLKRFATWMARQLSGWETKRSIYEKTENVWEHFS